MARRLTVPHCGSFGGAGLGSLLGRPARQLYVRFLVSNVKLPSFCLDFLLHLPITPCLREYSFLTITCLGSTAQLQLLVRNNSTSNPTGSALPSTASQPFALPLLLSLSPSSPLLSALRWPPCKPLNPSPNPMLASILTPSTSSGSLSLAPPSKKSRVASPSNQER